MQDTANIKSRIVSLIEQKGPSLPVGIARQLELSPLFASAFLSELLSEKKIKISNLRVGNSPLYFISGQEPQLENFSTHLKSKEKEAFILLKDKKFLQDNEQEPAIRIALRAIKDFAIPFEKESKIIWRYFIIPESEFNEPKKIKENPKEEIKKESEEQETKEVEIIPEKKKAKKKTISRKKNDKFFNKVKEFLSKKSIEILDIESVGQKDIMLKVNVEEKEKLVVAYNKKRITETDILKAHKKAEEINLKYIILSLGEPTRKFQNLIKAIKDLSEIEKLE